MQKTATCFLLLILVSAFSATLKAQNLVPNPSFEIYDTCPGNTIDQINRCLGWSSFGNTTDYFNACGVVNISSVPNTAFGYQYAATGNAFCGFLSFNIDTAINGNREYLGRSLGSPLIINQKYFVSLKVNRPNFANGTTGFIVSNKLGVRFTTVQNTQFMPIVPNNFAHIYSDSIITDTLNWVLIKGSFIADSAYTYIVIGNFFDNAHTDTLIAGGQNHEAYYFVDDICVSIDSSTCYQTMEQVSEYNKSPIQIYPNPAHNEIEINANDIQSLTLYDVLGRVIYASTSEISSPFQINTSSFSRGIYFLQARGRKGMVVRKVVLQ